jgi:hypothetical protein
MILSTSLNTSREKTVVLTPLTRGLISVLVMLFIAWGGWATTSTIDHGTRITRTETRLERLPIIEQKLDLLLQERGITNPSPSPPQNGTQPNWSRNP